MTQEHKDKIAQSMKGQKRSPETRAKMVAAWKKRGVSDEHRKRFAEAHKSRKFSPETRQKMREAKINSKKMFKDTKIELAIEEQLKERGISYTKQHPLFRVARVDFYLPELNVAVQCDGCYWHGCPQHFPDNYPEARERAEAQDAVLARNGVRVIRFWEHDIVASAKDCTAMI